MRTHAVISVRSFARAALLLAPLALAGAANAEDVKPRLEPEQVVAIFSNGNIDAVDDYYE